MVPEACVIYEPPRAGFPFLVVVFTHGSDPVVRPFWSLSDAKDCLKEMSLRALLDKAPRR